MTKTVKPFNDYVKRAIWLMYVAGGAICVALAFNAVLLFMSNLPGIAIDCLLCGVVFVVLLVLMHRQVNMTVRRADAYKRLYDREYKMRSVKNAQEMINLIIEDG